MQLQLLPEEGVLSGRPPRRRTAQIGASLKARAAAKPTAAKPKAAAPRFAKGISQSDLDVLTVNKRSEFRAHVGSPESGGWQAYHAIEGRERRWVGPVFTPDKDGLRSALKVSRALNEVGENLRMSEGGKVALVTHSNGPLWANTPQGRREARERAEAAGLTA